MKNDWPGTKENINAVIVVAHPDDETIWSGGTILTYPNWNWTVISLTWNLTDDPRGIQFKKAMELYKTLGVNIVNFSCLGKNDRDLVEEDQIGWKNGLMDLKLQHDIVLTHNLEGEYGHQHHKIVNKLVNECFENVWEFICPGAVNVAPQPFKSKNVVIPLNTDTLIKKTDIFNRCYTSELAIWKVMPEPMQYEFRTGPEIFTSL